MGDDFSPHHQLVESQRMCWFCEWSFEETADFNPKRTPPSKVKLNRNKQSSQSYIFETKQNLSKSSLSPGRLLLDDDKPCKKVVKLANRSYQKMGGRFDFPRVSVSISPLQSTPKTTLSKTPGSLLVVLCRISTFLRRRWCFFFCVCVWCLVILVLPSLWGVTVYKCGMNRGKDKMKYKMNTLE